MLLLLTIEGSLHNIAFKSANTMHTDLKEKRQRPCDCMSHQKLSADPHLSNILGCLGGFICTLLGPAGVLGEVVRQGLSSILHILLG